MSKNSAQIFWMYIWISYVQIKSFVKKIVFMACVKKTNKCLILLKLILNHRKLSF